MPKPNPTSTISARQAIRAGAGSQIEASTPASIPTPVSQRVRGRIANDVRIVEVHELVPDANNPRTVLPRVLAATLLEAAPTEPLVAAWARAEAVDLEYAKGVLRSRLIAARAADETPDDIEVADAKLGPLGSVMNLAIGIALNTLIQPLAGSRLPDGRTLILDGHRRHAAMLLLSAIGEEHGREAHVRFSDDLTELDRLVAQNDANTNREAVGAVDQFALVLKVRKLMSGVQTDNWQALAASSRDNPKLVSWARIAKRLGMQEALISRLMPLTRLSPKAIEAMRQGGVLAYQCAMTLGRADDAIRLRLLHEIEVAAERGTITPEVYDRILVAANLILLPGGTSMRIDELSEEQLRAGAAAVRQAITDKDALAEKLGAAIKQPGIPARKAAKSKHRQTTSPEAQLIQAIEDLVQSLDRIGTTMDWSQSQNSKSALALMQRLNQLVGTSKE